MALTIDELNIKINSDAKQATGGIDSLTKSLEKLKTITNGISSTASELQKFANAMTTLKDVGDVKVKITGLKALSNIGVSESTVTNLERVSNALKSFKDVPQKVSLTPIAHGITALDNATKGLDATRLSQFATQISGVATALQPLSTLGKSDLGSYFNQLNKIPEIINTLDNETLERFSVTVQKVTETLRPLAAEAEKLAPVFEKLPSSVSGAIKAYDRLQKSSQKTASSQNVLAKALKNVTRQFASFFTLRHIYRFLSDCLEVSNDYAETLNLFTVALGDASESMKNYAKTVESVMGIDSAEWMNNQAVFMQTLTGFGVAEDEAASMSKTLTQLGYDITSLWNADADLVMSRLESAMTGQIKGMKNYGYNVSVAALKETALALGIEKTVSSMTEAEKAQLRFITIMRNAHGTMGDMAKTLLSPANAMRVYASTITRLKRALGDIISVLLTRFLPYMQATVELLTELANHIAISFGFEVEELPSSVVDSVGNLTGELEDGQDEAKELKKQLMGFDEINLLKSGEDNNSNLADGLGIDMSLYDYDFLANANRKRIDEIKEKLNGLLEKLKEFKDFIEKFSPILKGLGVAFASAFAINWIGDRLKGLISHINPASNALLMLDDVLYTFRNTAKTTKNPLKILGSGFKNLWSNFKTLMSGLSPITKGLTSIIALATEFVVVKNAIYDLVTGNKSLEESLLNIIPVCGAVGVAMYAMLGPWGLVAAAIVAVIGAIAGFIDAEKKIRSEGVKAEFYDGLGVSINELADDYSELMESIKATYQPSIDAKNAIDETKTSIGNTTTEITNLASQFELGYLDIQETVPLIKAEFDKLYEDTLEVLSKEKDLIYTALAGSVGDALEDMGFDLEEIGLLIGSVVNNTTIEVERLKKENEELMASLQNGTAAEGAMSQYLENVKKIAELSGVDTSELDAFQDKIVNLVPKDIDWKTDDLTGVFEQISTSTKEAKDAVSESYDGILSSLEHMKSLTVDQNEIKVFDSLIEAIGKDKDTKLAKIDATVSEVVNGLQDDLLKGVKDRYDTALGEWDSMSWFDKMLYNWNRDTYVRGVLETYQNDIVNPIATDMKKSLGDAFNDSVWADKAMNDLMDGLKLSAYAISTGKTGDFDFAEQFATNFQNAIDTYMPNVGNNIGESFIDGMADGIKDNKNVVADAVAGTLSEVEFKAQIQGGGGANPTLKFSMYKYASGGFPNMGEMFIARESGPEMVGRIGNKTAVANNSQIVNGITSGVYRAMMMAQADGGSNNGGTARIIVQIGDRAVGEAAVEYINGEIRQTGTNPINY